MRLTFEKRNYDIAVVNSQIESYCKEKDISDDALLKMQLISEEFLSNILFPNFDGEVTILFFLKDKNRVLSFEYSGADFMKKINETTIISHKLLEKQAKDIISTTIGDITTVSFII